MIRSQSLPLELSSLSIRSAKFGQGTNSNFMLTLVLAVKSLLSSTSALAGSHAAQQSVIVLPWACAAPLPNPRTPAAAIAARAGSFFKIAFISGSPFVAGPGTSIRGPTRRSLQVLGRQDLHPRLHHVECPANVLAQRAQHARSGADAVVDVLRQQIGEAAIAEQRAMLVGEVVRDHRDVVGESGIGESTGQPGAARADVVEAGDARRVDAFL